MPAPVSHLTYHGMKIVDSLETDRAVSAQRQWMGGWLSAFSLAE